MYSVGVWNIKQYVFIILILSWKRINILRLHSIRLEKKKTLGDQNHIHGSSVGTYGHFPLGCLNLKKTVCYGKCVNEWTMHPKKTLCALYWHCLVLLARMCSNTSIIDHFNGLPERSVCIFLSLLFYTCCFKESFVPNCFLAANIFRDCNPILPEHF